MAGCLAAAVTIAALAGPAGAADVSAASGVAGTAEKAGTGTRATGTGARAQYVPPRAGSTARGALGRHSLLIQPVYWGDVAPATLDSTAIGAEVRSTSTYFRTASGSKITAVLNQIRPWTKISLSEDQAASCDTAAIEKATRAVAPDTPGSLNHLQIVFPQTSACEFGTLSSRGLTAAGDGASFFNGPEALTWATMAFGIGSNAGLGMSNALDCWTDAEHSAPTPLSGYCKQQSGGDPWDLMGWWPYGQVGKLSAANLRRLGVFSSQEFIELTPGAGLQYPFLRPLTAGSGLRGFSATVGTQRFTVEFRTPVGLDHWIDDLTWVDSTGATRTDPGGGVIVRYQDLSGSSPQDSNSLDFHADGKVASTGRHMGLEAGESWTSPGAMVRVQVLSTTSAGASLRVDFPGINKVERWSGGDRYSTSAAISARSYSPGVPVAYVASGLVFSDALSGAPVAGKDKGPILLSSATSIPGAVQAELRRLQPGRIVILGGPATISSEVASKLATYTSGAVTRLAGSDRFSTSATISANSFTPGVGTVYIASGRVYTDALSGAPVAGKNSSPILLVDTTAIPSSIATELRRLQPRRIVVMGGPNTISETVLAGLRAYTSGSVTRVAGADRFATSAAISGGNYGPGVPVVYVASGHIFPDALSGAPVAGMTRGPILLVDTSTVPKVVSAEIKRLQPGRIVVLGGPNTVAESVRAVLGSYLP